MRELAHIGMFVAVPCLIGCLVLFARIVGKRLRTNRKTGTWLVRYDSLTPWIERRK